MMTYATIPGVRKPMPRIVVGTGELGSSLPAIFQSRSQRRGWFAYLDAVFEMGCTAFDTAAVYQAGGTERLLGDWLKDRRERALLISKGANPSGSGKSRFTPQALISDVHRSLRRLRVEHIDIYLLHRDDPSAPLEPMIDTLCALQLEGKIGAYGLSNATHERLHAALGYARSRGGPTPVLSSPQFSLFDWVSPPWPGSVSIAGDEGRAARLAHKDSQLAVLAWSPLGRGVFTERPSARKFYGSQVNLERKRRATELAKDKGVTPAQIALAYLFHQPFPVFAAVASRSVENMKLNVDAAKLVLSADEVRLLDEPGSE